MTERHPLKPFLPKGAKILMLGSFPPPMKLSEILAQIPDCKSIISIGGKSAEIVADILGVKTPAVGEFVETVFSNRTIRLYRMPSTSRAFPLKIEVKAQAYEVIKGICKARFLFQVNIQIKHHRYAEYQSDCYGTQNHHQTAYFDKYCCRNAHHQQEQRCYRDVHQYFGDFFKNNTWFHFY
jgi:hypothetical protein